MVMRYGWRSLGRVWAGVLWRIISARVRFGAVGRSVGGLRAFRGSVGVFARLSVWAVRFRIRSARERFSAGTVAGRLALRLCPWAACCP